MDIVSWFADLGLADASSVGGKGANLGELTRAGLPVPPGFVVTASAYLSSMDAGGVRRPRGRAGAGSDATAVAADDAARRRDLVDQAGMSVDVRSAVVAACRELCRRSADVDIDVMPLRIVSIGRHDARRASSEVDAVGQGPIRCCPQRPCGARR